MNPEGRPGKPKKRHPVPGENEGGPTTSFLDLRGAGSVRKKLKQSRERQKRGREGGLRHAACKGPAPEIVSRST